MSEKARSLDVLAAAIKAAVEQAQDLENEIRALGQKKQEKFSDIKKLQGEFDAQVSELRKEGGKLYGTNW